MEGAWIIFDICCGRRTLAVVRCVSVLQPCSLLNLNFHCSTVWPWAHLCKPTETHKQEQNQQTIDTQLKFTFVWQPRVIRLWLDSFMHLFFIKYLRAKLCYVHINKPTPSPPPQSQSTGQRIGLCTAQWTPKWESTPRHLEQGHFNVVGGGGTEISCRKHICNIVYYTQMLWLMVFTPGSRTSESTSKNG